MLPFNLGGIRIIKYERTFIYYIKAYPRQSVGVRDTKRETLLALKKNVFINIWTKYRKLIEHPVRKQTFIECG